MAYKIEFHPEASRDFDGLDNSTKKEATKKIDELTDNPLLGKPLGNKLGINLTGFFKLYIAKKKYRIVYRLIGGAVEVVEIVGIGKREKAEIYKLVARRLAKLTKPR